MKRNVIFVLCLAAALTIISPATSAEPACQPIRGTIESSYTTDNCPSLCTAGVINAGALTGTTFFYVTSTSYRDGVLFFCGVFIVNTATGTATFDTCGTVNGANGRYEEWFNMTSGTGSFEGTTGRLFSGGTSSATGFKGTFEGALCSN